MNSRRRFLFLALSFIYAATSAIGSAFTVIPEGAAPSTRQWVIAIALAVNAGVGVVLGVLPTLYGQPLPTPPTTPGAGPMRSDAVRSG